MDTIQTIAACITIAVLTAFVFYQGSKIDDLYQDRILSGTTAAHWQDLYEDTRAEYEILEDEALTLRETISNLEKSVTIALGETERAELRPLEYDFPLHD